jgi:hypothetical protein
MGYLYKRRKVIIIIIRILNLDESLDLMSSNNKLLYENAMNERSLPDSKHYHDYFTSTGQVKDTGTGSRLGGRRRSSSARKSSAKKRASRRKPRSAKKRASRRYRHRRA